MTTTTDDSNDFLATGFSSGTRSGLLKLAAAAPDTTAPVVVSVAMPADGGYGVGAPLTFTVTFDENVMVTGTASALALTIGSTPRTATFVSAVANTITYSYIVQAGDIDANGIAVGAIALNGSTVRDAAGNDSDLSLGGRIPPTAGILVDAMAPAVSGTVDAPAAGSYAAGEILEFTVTFDENVTVTGTDSTLSLTVGGTGRDAQFVSATGNSVTYAYTVQAGDAGGIALGAIAPGLSTFLDAAGNDADLTLTGHLPDLSGVTIDSGGPIIGGPAFAGATVNGATLVLSYTGAGMLDAAHGPVPEDFLVTLGGAGVTVTGVVVDAGAQTVTLTLGTAATHGQAVTVAYTDPSAGDDVNALQDMLGNDAVSLPATSVTNTTSAPPAPPVVVRPGNTTSIDGVKVTLDTDVRSDGTVVQVVTVPVVTPSRVEQVGGNGVADIPLAKDAGGGALLTAQVPVGFGLQSSGTGAPKTPADALTDLIREIRAHTTISPGQTQLTGGGTAFIDALGADTPLLVQTIIVTGNGNQAGAPLGFSSPAGDTAQTALVIDTRGAANPALELQNVEFAAIIGAATVTGGAGSQHVWGDGASQTIFLGADDDVLHGGGGDDIVGSAGGNDRIYGDDGNDIVFGGAGDDVLDGGTGRDIARFSGSAGDYSLRFKDGALVMTALAGNDGTDTVVAVETLRFTGGQETGSAAVIARLYEGVLHRAASAAEVAYWQDAVDGGASVHDVAGAIVGSAEARQLHGASGDQAYVDSLYQAVLGRTAGTGESAFWVGQLAAGTDRAAVALGFVNSAEKLATTVDLDFNASDAAVLVRMYHAMFGRTPDEAGLNFWLASHEQGVSLGAIADAFVASGEAAALLKEDSDAAFIDHLYRTALDRAPSGAEQAQLLSQLQDGVYDRGQVLLNVAESAASIAIVGSVTTSLDLL